jgi:hypothetical protein
MLFKNSVRTSKKTQHFTITKINWVTLFKEILAVYSENHTKHINTLCGQNAELLIVEAGGTYSYHWVEKGSNGCIQGTADCALSRIISRIS